MPEFQCTTAPTANTLVIGVTQSGETADTLAALTMEKQRRSDQLPQYQPRLGITNRIDSSLATLVNQIIDTHAGIEIELLLPKALSPS